MVSPEDGGEQLMMTSRCIRRRRPKNELTKLHDASVPALESLSEQFKGSVWQRPMGKIGGDLIVVWQASASQLVMVTADVMGQGVAAAIVVGAMRALLHEQQHAGTIQPSALLAALNRPLAALYHPRFVTAAACLLDAEAGTITSAGAGHPSILVRREDEVTELASESIPLGIWEEEAFFDQTVPLHPGDTVVLYTDGISESLAKGGLRVRHGGRSRAGAETNRSGTA